MAAKTIPRAIYSSQHSIEVILHNNDVHNVCLPAGRVVAYATKTLQYHEARFFMLKLWAHITWIVQECNNCLAKQRKVDLHRCQYQVHELSNHELVYIYLMRQLLLDRDG